MPSPVPFTVAEGMRGGLTRKRLRNRSLDRSIWGVRRAATDTRTLDDRCRMLALRMPPAAFFSHATAALLLGAPLPPGMERSPLLHIAIAAPGRAPHARGVRGHELGIGDGDVTATRGIRHTSAARTWCDLAAVLSLHDLVAVGDYLIHRRLPLTSREELATIARRFIGRRGMRRMREALPLLNDRAESHPESVLRVILELAGLPTPSINRDIVDTDDGFIARTDFTFKAFRLILEYQGDYHRKSKEQWRKDMTRRSRLEAEGWQVMELNADDLKDPGELVARIRSVLIRRGWRP